MLLMTSLIVTVGASQALDIAVRAILDPGEEVLIPEPCFVAYEALVSLAGGKAVHIHTNAERGFKASAADFEAVLTERTKAIILCTPSNPTGSVYSKKELEEIAAFAEKHDLIVIADEIYAEPDIR